jgi:hypothetical protein
MQPGLSWYGIGVAGCSLVRPTAAWLSREQTGVVRRSWVWPNLARCSLGQPGVTICSQVRPGMARCSQIHLGVDGRDLVSPSTPLPILPLKRMGDKWTDA